MGLSNRTETGLQHGLLSLHQEDCAQAHQEVPSPPGRSLHARRQIMEKTNWYWFARPPPLQGPVLDAIHWLRHQGRRSSPMLGPEELQEVRRQQPAELEVLMMNNRVFCAKIAH